MVHTIFRDGGWVEEHLTWEGENRVSRQGTKDVFKDVVDPDWDELCKVRPGERPVEEVADVGKDEFVASGTARKRRIAAADAATSAAEKAKGTMPATSPKSKTTRKEKDDFVTYEDDKMTDAGDHEAQQATPPATTAPTCESPQAANSAFSNPGWD